MKKVITFLSTVALAIMAGIMIPQGASSKIVTNVPADISGNELRAVVIEDFEAAEVSEKGWQVSSTPKKFNSAEAEKKFKRKNPVPTLELKLIDGGPNDLKPEAWSLTDKGKKKEKVLGVHFRFQYPGHNSVHIMAPLEVQWQTGDVVKTYDPRTGSNEQERGLQLPGKAQAISLWVHGRGHPYTLEVWVKDYRGNTHILKFGSVNFVGWRPMKVFVPASIPQSYESYPQTRVAKITRFVLRAQAMSPAEELTTDAYFFFDQVKVLTDTYEVNFDGSDLHKAFDGGSKGGDKKQQ